MAESKEFIEWVKGQAKKHPSNYKITNTDKLTSKYILNKYSTWGDLYKSVNVVGFEKPIEKSEPKKPDATYKLQKDKNAAEAKIKGTETELQRVKRDLELSDIGTEEYNKAKKRIQELNNSLSTYKKDLENVNKGLSEYSRNKKAEKTKKSAQEKLKDVPKIREQAIKAQDAGDTATAKKLNDEADAIETAAAASASKVDTPKKDSKTGTQFQLSDEENVANLLGSANVSMDNSGRPIVQVTSPNKLDPVTGNPSVEQVYLYLTTTKGGTGEKAIFFGTSDVIRDRYQKQLIKNYGSKQAVIDKLYKAGYLKTNKEVPTSSYLAALDDAAAEYTVAQVNAYKQEGVKEFPTMDEFLATKKGTGLGGTRTKSNILEFSDTSATKIINAISQQFFGRDANGKELKNLIPLINQELKKNPDLVSTTTDAEGNVIRSKTKTGLDVEQFLIDEISQKDEAKANKVLGYYNVFKESLGVN
jgi:hypothetical protein